MDGTKVCPKHIEKPAFIYGQCIGCELENFHSLLQQKDEEIEQLTKREVPDMSQLTHNDLFQVKALISDNGADYLINVIRHIAKLERSTP